MSLEVDEPWAGWRGFGMDTVVRRSSQRLPEVYGRDKRRDKHTKQSAEPAAADSNGKVKGRGLMKSPWWQTAKL